MSGKWRIVCDAGGTNIRIARSFGPRDVRDATVLPAVAGLVMEDCLASYAGRFDAHETLAGAAIAAAGPVEEGTTRLTNVDISISAAKVREALGGPVRLINDLEAVAWGLPHLAPQERAPVCEVDLPLQGARIAINVGTGFGAAVLIETPAGPFALACEPGHMKLASGTMLGPHERMASLSIEEAISGMALAQSMCGPWSLSERLRAEPGACGLFEAASSCAEGRRFISDFSALLGQVCGDLVLATGSWGGVYLCGSVATAWSAHADRDGFCSAFHDKGPMRARMLRTGVSVIALRTPAFLGLSAVPLP